MTWIDIKNIRQVGVLSVGPIHLLIKKRVSRRRPGRPSGTCATRSINLEQRQS